MKPSAAFAAGLWTGAVVAATAVAVYVQLMPGRGVDRKMPAAGGVDDVSRLRQENAKLNAENQRLKQTNADLTKGLEATALTDSRRTGRDTPFRQPTGAAATLEKSIAEAVATGDLDALPQIETLAQENNVAALDAVALMAVYDGGTALMRVWNSGKLNNANVFRAARHVTATLEVNPHAAEFLHQVLLNAAADQRLVTEILDGIARPSLPAAAGELGFKQDFGYRLQLLDSLRTATGTGSLRVRIEEVRVDLADRLAAAQAQAR